MMDYSDYTKVNLKQFTGHKDEVNCVAFSPDFEILVTGSDDERVRIFNAKTGRFVVKLKGHEGAIRHVAVSPDSRTIASASFDNTAILWQTGDGSLKHVLRGHTKSVEVVAFSFDSCKLISGSFDKMAIVWDVKTGCRLQTLSGHDSVVQSTASSICGRYIATGSWDYTVRLWTLAQIPTDCEESSDDTPHIGDIINCRVLRGHTRNIQCVVFSKHGMLATASWDKTVRLWNIRKGNILHVLIGHTGWVRAISFSSDGYYMASSADDDTVRVWDVVDGQCVKTLTADDAIDGAQHCGFTKRGALVASGIASSEVHLI